MDDWMRSMAYQMTLLAGFDHAAARMHDRLMTWLTRVDANDPMTERAADRIAAWHLKSKAIGWRWRAPINQAVPLPSAN
jgi:hypothetical protein